MMIIKSEEEEEGMKIFWIIINIVMMLLKLNYNLSNIKLLIYSPAQSTRSSMSTTISTTIITQRHH